MRDRLLTVILVLLAACGGAAEPAPTPPEQTTIPPGTTSLPTTALPEGELVLLTHDSFQLSDEVLDTFTVETGFEVSVLRGGDAGTMVNQAILTKDNPLADVLYGVDNTFLSRALAAGIFHAYRPAGIELVPESLDLDPEGNVTPIDFGDVCLNYDKAAFAALDVPPPSGLLDLVEAPYRGLLVVENPATSSPGLAFLLATIGTFPETAEYTWLDFWSDLKANDVLVTSGWEEAYRSAFSLYGGDRPLVVSYASSPPAEVIFAEEPITEAPTAVILAGCFRQIEFAGILAGTEQTAAAQQFIDFLLTLRVQEDIPLNMFVFPANRQADLPEEFVAYTEIPTDPVTLDPDAIDANRERWIEAWTEIVLP